MSLYPVSSLALAIVLLQSTITGQISLKRAVIIWYTSI
jgi:hypothetical protein